MKMKGMHDDKVTWSALGEVGYVKIMPWLDEEGESVIVDSIPLDVGPHMIVFDLTAHGEVYGFELLVNHKERQQTPYYIRKAQEKETSVEVRSQQVREELDEAYEALDEAIEQAKAAQDTIRILLRDEGVSR